MTTKTSPYLKVQFIREDGYLGSLWAARIECVWGDAERGEFAGYVCTEYQTNTVWKIEAWRVQGIENKVMLIELA
jgi:hypothetical protein